MHSTRRCSVDGCDRTDVKARELCGKHYARARKAGDLTRVDPSEKRISLFLARVEKTDSCWIWRGRLDRDGYGKTSLDNRNQGAHRVSYQLFVGQIPDGLTIDHVRSRGCTSRACVNPAHLEPVTIRENTIRGDSPQLSAERQLRKTHCPQGHPYVGHNLVIDEGGKRRCRECINAKSRRYLNRKALSHGK